MSSNSAETETQHQTYWCHECDMSVHLFTAHPSLCPHCSLDHLELMDDPTPTTDTFLLDDDSPSFRRLFLPFFNENDDEDDATTNALILPTIKITSSLLDGMEDPLLLCAVCKDQFLIDVDAKVLPCNHLFHPHCILPWLNSNHHSCPLCRFQLPTTTPTPKKIDSLSDSSSPSHIMDCFTNVGMQLGFTHQDDDFPDVGLLSNFLPSHF